MAATKQKSSIRKRIFEIIEVGALDDRVSRRYDIFNLISIVVNLAVGILYTFEEMRSSFGSLLLSIEAVTVVFLQWIMVCVCGRHNFFIQN